MDNYIVINGNKAELTPEQLDTLGIKVSKAKENSFERNEKYEEYYAINRNGEISTLYEHYTCYDNQLYDAANYCTNASLMEQRALHEILNRQLWRFSMLHNGDKINWDDYSTKYYIFYAHKNNKYCVEYNNECQAASTIYFYSREIAQQAIDEIVNPFVAKHPDFKL